MNTEYSTPSQRRSNPSFGINLERSILSGFATSILTFGTLFVVLYIHTMHCFAVETNVKMTAICQVQTRYLVPGTRYRKSCAPVQHYRVRSFLLSVDLVLHTEKFTCAEKKTYYFSIVRYFLYSPVRLQSRSGYKVPGSWDGPGSGYPMNHS